MSNLGASNVGVVALTQRVDIAPGHGERRDGLDQRWWPLLAACGLLPLILPNHAETALALFQAHTGGLILTGGNDLAAYGGGAPERDATEGLLLRAALAAGRPVLGVCRGMQLILDHFGTPLQQVTDHIACRHAVRDKGGGVRQVNSYHGWAAVAVAPPLQVMARADDGVVEAVRHPTLPCIGIMWHPERDEPAAEADRDLLQTLFITRN